MTRTAADDREEARVRAVYARREDPALARRYAWDSPAHVLQIQERERAVLSLLARHDFLPLAGRAAVELGCGTGFWLRELVKWGARPAGLAGVDLLAGRIEAARRLSPADVTFVCASAAETGLPSARYDLVLQSMLLSSVLDPAVRRAIAAEMCRLLRPGGAILWYDVRVGNPSNPDVQSLPRRAVAELFPGARLHLQRITLAPPLARRVAGPAPWLAYGLGRLPMLRSHYIGLIWPAASNGAEDG